MRKEPGGDQLAAKGIYRNAVRSSRAFFVKSSGLRWLSMMLLTPIPWAQRVWALPCLTVLAPSERYHQTRGQRHKTLPDWARQMILQLRRWLPSRVLVVVADKTYAVLELLGACVRWPAPVTVVMRLRLDAALYDPAPARTPGTKGAPRKKGARQPTLATRLQDPQTTWTEVTLAWYGGGTRTVEVASDTAVWYHAGKPTVPLRWVLVRDPAKQFAPQALLCTDLTARAEQIVAWFVLRWQLEVTFEEARAHLGVETQRQWADLAVLRTTPALLGLFALVTLLAHQLLQGHDLPARSAAWYSKPLPTFSDTLALVRQQLWPGTISYISPANPDIVEIPRPLLDRLMDTLAFAA